MEVITSPALAAFWSASQRRAGRRVAFVPTMGALHEGHLALVQAARQPGFSVAASVFVNPLQFNNKDDLERYPRQPEQDTALLREAGCDMLFLPQAEALFAGMTERDHDLGGLDEQLEGPSRPGHFAGVATVVERLFHFVRPDRACFGEKDRQQLAIIQHVARNERWPVEVVGVPTVRTKEGLALSSRNARLSPAELQQALVLHRGLETARALAFHTPVEQVLEAARAVVQRGHDVELDYLEIVDPVTLRSISDWGAREEVIALVAARVGPVRLIDNVTLRR